LDLIAVELDIATHECQAVLTPKQSIKGDKLTLYDLEVVMTQHFCQLYQGKVVRNDEDGEVLLTAVNGVCFYCGKRVHMANKCPNYNSNNADKKSVSKKCLNCNKKGHLAKDCLFNESNKDKRPK
jgi:Zinc knuckle